MAIIIELGSIKFILKGAISPVNLKIPSCLKINKLLLNALEIGAQRDAEVANWTAEWQLKNAGLIEGSPSQARAKLFKDKMAFTKDLQARTAPDVLAIKSQLPGMVQSNTGLVPNKKILFRSNPNTP